MVASEISPGQDFRNSVRTELAGGHDHFLRTPLREVDLVLVTSGRKRVVAVEMKLTSAPKPSRGFWSAAEDLEPRESFVRLPRYGALSATPRCVRATGHSAVETGEPLMQLKAGPEGASPTPWP